MDVEYISKFNNLQGLYLKEDKHLLDRCFGFLKSRKMYSDIEDFELEAAEYFRRAGRFEMATKHVPFATEKLMSCQLMFYFLSSKFMIRFPRPPPVSKE